MLDWIDDGRETKFTYLNEETGVKIDLAGSYGEKRKSIQCKLSLPLQEVIASFHQEFLDGGWKLLDYSYQPGISHHVDIDYHFAICKNKGVKRGEIYEV